MQRLALACISIALLYLTACSRPAATQTPSLKRVASANAEARFEIPVSLGTQPSLQLSAALVQNPILSVSGCASGYQYSGPLRDLSLYTQDYNCLGTILRFTMDGITFEAPANPYVGAGSQIIYTDAAQGATAIVTVLSQLSSPLLLSDSLSFSVARLSRGSGFIFTLPKVRIDSDQDTLVEEAGSVAHLTISRNTSDDVLRVNLDLSGIAAPRLAPGSVPAFLDFAPGETQKILNLTAPNNGLPEDDDTALVEIDTGAYLIDTFSSVSLPIRDPAPTIALAASFVGSTDIALDPIISADAYTTTPTQTSGPNGGTLNFYYIGNSLRVGASKEGVYTATVTAAAMNGNASTASTTITFDLDPPVIGTVSLINGAADGIINALDASAAQAVIAVPTISDLSAATLSYRLVSAVTICNGALTYNTDLPLANDAAMSGTADFKVCVKALDSFSHAAYSESPIFGYMTTYSVAVLSNLPSALSSQATTAITVGGLGVTAYKFKFGFVPFDCATSGYGTPIEVGTPIAIALSAYNDSDVNLCVLAQNAAGNWQAEASVTSYAWHVDLTPPVAPADFTVSRQSERLAIKFDANVTDTSGYLLIRSSGALSGFAPTAGVSYNQGDATGNGTVLYKGAQKTIYDNKIGDTSTWTYTLYAYDTALNYSIAQSASNSADPKVLFNAASGFDRFVRGGVRVSRDGSGRVYAWGDFTTYGSTPLTKIMRFNEDGTVDTGFTPPVINNTVYAMSEDSSGRLYIGGAFTTIGGVTRTRVARLLANGSLDTSFVTTTGPDNIVYGMDLDETLGRLYIGGSFVKVGTTTVNRIAALTLTGALNTTFATGTGLDNVVYAVRIDPVLGGIYFSGTFTKYKGATVTTNTAKLMKLQTSGALDPSFVSAAGFGTSTSINVYALELDSFNNVYAAGNFTTYKGSSSYKYLMRMSATGAADTTFAVTNKFNSTVWSLDLDEENSSLYVGGDFTLYGTKAANRIAALTLDAAGSLNTSFSTNVGTGANSTIYGVANTPTGLFVGGNLTLYKGTNVAYIAKLATSNQSLTGALAVGTMFNAQSNAAAIGASENALYIGGTFTTYRGAAVSRLVKVDATGALDTSFLPTLNGGVNALLYEAASGKLIAAGAFSTVGGSTSKRIVRLTSTGTVDATFSTATAFDSDVYTLAAGSSGSIWVGGKFTVWNAAANKYIAKLTTAGTPDPSFSSGTGFNNYIYAIAPTADGGAIVGGAFTSYNGVAVNRIVKLFADGTIDGSFAIGSGMNNTVRSIQIIGGAVYVGGDFTSYAGTTKNRIARLGLNGALDASFASGSGFNSSVYDLKYDAQSDRIIAVGNFTTYAGATAGRMASLTTSGALDTTLAPSPGFGAIANSVLPTYNGLLVTGTFVTFNSLVNDFIARVSFYGAMN